MSQNDQVHNAVQERYGAIARSLDVVQPAAASCCSPASNAEQTQAADCGCNNKLYDDALLEGLPGDVTNLSLG